MAKGLFYHLLLTDDCNLCCSYCRGKTLEEFEPEGEDVEIDYNLPSELKFDLKHLYKFLENDREGVLTFYGGESLLRLDLIRKVMDEAPVRRFMVQTNGILLHLLEKEYVNRFETILVSLDGNEKLNDYHRGEGTYQKVIDNIKLIRKNGFRGELIARMTIAEDTDIYEAVKYLAENEDFSFDSIHWQMDANFWNDYRKRNFGRWVKGYNKGIGKLVKLWAEKIKETGKVPKWYPFIDPVEDMLLGRKTLLRCGSGHTNYSVLTDGSIVPCPIMVGMKEYYLGNVKKTKPEKLNAVKVGPPCTECEILDFCGGRCLYANIVKPWPEEGRKLVCGTVKVLRDELKSALPKINKLIKDGKIRTSDFAHTKYQGPEIIP